MKKNTSSNILEKIEVSKERIKEFQTMINYWEGGKVANFRNTECFVNKSSSGCPLFTD